VKCTDNSDRTNKFTAFETPDPNDAKGIYTEHFFNKNPVLGMLLMLEG
jgi:hypothetical protein